MKSAKNTIAYDAKANVMPVSQAARWARFEFFTVPQKTSKNQWGGTVGTDSTDVSRARARARVENTVPYVPTVPSVSKELKIGNILRHGSENQPCPTVPIQ